MNWGVLEHIEDLPDAFRELDRIGKPECLYAFAVPTDLWLLLSIPAQYLNKIIHSVYLIKQKLKRSNPASESSTAVSIPLQKRKRARFHAILDKIKPRGHGTTGEFFRCHEAFKIESWRELFRANGFHIVAVKPLLIYAPSELPIVPVLPPAPNLGLCSSVLFLLKRTSSDLT